MIALITPTGARPEQIQLCAEFMKRQDFKGPVLWIIIDDADPVTTDFITEGFRENWTIIKVYPTIKWKVGMNTQATNLIAGVDIAIKHDLNAIFIIEDDDYYKPNYLRIMLEKMQGFDIVGEKYTVYYNVVKHLVFQNQNDQHASLFQVAFVPSLLPVFRRVCMDVGKRFIDVRFFREARSLKCKINLFNSENLAVGIKGMAGRTGIGFGHRMGVGPYDLKRMSIDLNCVRLKELIGDDFVYYQRN